MNARTEVQDAPVTESPANTSGGRRKWLVAAAALLLAGGAGGAAWFWWAGAAQSAPEAEAPAAPARNPVFVPLDQFTVNLADEGGERFAQMSVTLEVLDGDVGSTIKTQMPAIRNSILLLLTSKSSNELLTVAGKEQLARQIAEQTGKHLGWTPAAAGAPAAASGQRADPKGRSRPNPIVAVHFAHFIVQ